MKKVLFVATVVKTHIMVFHLPYLELFKNNGFETHVCSRNDYENKDDCNIPYCDKYYDLPFERSPFKLENLKAYKELKKLIDDNNYDIIHCHTPMGGVLARIAGRKSRKKGTKIIYTAHGFHFFKGAPVINWLLYYPIERWLARYTDVLITINKEDFSRAKNFKAHRLLYIPGVGVSTKKFCQVNIVIKEKRKQIGIIEDSFVILSVGELNKNKNHEVIIKAIAKLKNKNIQYVLCGLGPLNSYLMELAEKLGITEQVKFLGFRNDISEIYKAADLFAFPSYREGLSLSLMEAMVSGLPVVCSDIRGNTDLIENGKGGYLVKPDNIHGWVTAIERIINGDKLDMSNINSQNIKDYDLASVIEKMKNIYDFD